MSLNEAALKLLSPAAREAFFVAREAAENGDDYSLRVFAALRTYPVSFEQFVTDPDFLGSDALYSEVLKELIDLNNPEVDGCEYRARLWTRYAEAILTGGIGTGKSTLAIYSMLYQLYVLSCFRHPHDQFELDPTSEIVIVFQNRTERLAKVVDYDRFKALVDQSPYFREQFRYDHRVKSELKFPNRIIVRPVSGADTAVIGQNVFSGVIDEVNFMETVGRSSRSRDGRTYDQANALYESIATRRASRFQKLGRLPGLLCLVSSRRYRGQFTDIKEEERRRQLQETGSTTIYLYDKRLWDVKPKGTYSGKTFRVFTGDLARKPRILKNDDLPVADKTLFIDVPVEHRAEFERDILNALRDIAGVSTQAIQPFFTNREAVAACFVDRPSILSSSETTLVEGGLFLDTDQFHLPDLIRFAHLDLSITGDATAIAIGCVEEFVEVERGGDTEMLPLIYVDLILRVMPPSDGEVPYHRIRELLYLYGKRACACITLPRTVSSLWTCCKRCSAMASGRGNVLWTEPRFPMNS